MKKILILLTALIAISACSKDDSDWEKIIFLSEEEQTQLNNELVGYWKNLSSKNNDYVYTKEFLRNACGGVGGDTLVFPRTERLPIPTPYILSVGPELEGHKTIQIDQSDISYSNDYTEIYYTSYYILNDTMYFYEGVKYKNKAPTIERKEKYKKLSNVAIIKEEDINKELIGKWTCKRGYIIELFDFKYQHSFGQELENYAIEYVGKLYSYSILNSRLVEWGYYDRGKKTIIHGNDIYTKME